MTAKKTCLVVDDAEVIRRVARQIIETLDFDVSDADSGQRGVESCQAAMPDVILVDWHMPGMATLEFILSVRKLPGGGQPLIIYCTTDNDPVDIARALAAGANEFILKPFDRQGLTAKLAEQLQPA